MEEELPLTARQNVDRGLRISLLVRSDLCVMEQPVALLVEEGHVHTEPIGSADATVSENALSFFQVTSPQESASQEESSWKMEEKI
jgi:hypothetical protein